MANLATYLQTVADFINRVAPFSGNPLIQKSEDLTVRQLLANSIVFKEGTVSTITSPLAAFTCDFASTDEFAINTSASIGAAFTVTLAGLENNRIGRLNITKKSADVFSFANGTIFPYAATLQTGTVLRFLIFKIGSNYFAEILKEHIMTTSNITDSAVTTAKIADSNVTTAKLNNLAVTGAKIANATIREEKVNKFDFCTTNSSLSIGDFDDIIYPGIYYGNGEETNRPNNNKGMLLVTSTGIIVHHVWISISLVGGNPSIQTRRYSSGSWSTWSSPNG